MSIANEVIRLQNAKADIKTSIEKRGATIGTENTIDTYAAILDSCPFIVEGTFIPEADTKIFSMSGLPFTPTYLGICCPSGCSSSSTLVQTVTMGVKPKTEAGGLTYRRANGNNLVAFLGKNSGAIKWTEDSVTLTVPDSAECCFLSGVTYYYYIIGGSE